METTNTATTYRGIRVYRDTIMGTTSWVSEYVGTTKRVRFKCATLVGVELDIDHYLDSNMSDIKPNRNLYLLRGVPGAGKSTLATTIASVVLAADDYFLNSDGIYKFERAYLRVAHDDCLMRTKIAMTRCIADIAIANTFTREWEMVKYFKLAEEFGYTVHSMVVENRHGGQNVHGVPEDAIQKMKDRFEVKL